ncbi:MAG: L-threonylcarbamoyladenylate synthase [Ruminococcus sp.]|nr:L-threonylcarbamoyladenylate synthase [Ruminococcus sp.]
MNIKRIVSEIKEGNLVITPTDTVYGILCDATNITAIKKVYEAKKREFHKPLILLVDSISMLKSYTSNITPLEHDIISKYLPGKLTILLKKNNKVNDIITNNSPLVGIRIPDNKDLLKIIKEVGNPLVSTSANISKKETITNISNIEKELLEYISYIEDGGTITSLPSSIIKIENEKIIVLREGEVSKSILEEYNYKE